MPLDLAHRLLMTQAVSRRDVEAALLQHTKTRVSFISALLELRPRLLPILEQELSQDRPLTADLSPDPSLLRWLPEGFCMTQFGFPIGITTSTNLVDVLVAEPNDEHVRAEFSYHLKADVRLLRGRIRHIAEHLESLEGHLVPHTVRHHSWLHAGPGGLQVAAPPSVAGPQSTHNGPATKRGVAPPALSNLVAQRVSSKHRDTLKPPSFHPMAEEEIRQSRLVTPLAPAGHLAAPSVPVIVEPEPLEQGREALAEQVVQAPSPTTADEALKSEALQSGTQTPNAERSNGGQSVAAADEAVPSQTSALNAEPSDAAEDTAQDWLDAKQGLLSAQGPDDIVEHMLLGVRALCEEAVVLSVRNDEIKSRARALLGGPVQRDFSRALSLGETQVVGMAIEKGQLLGRLPVATREQRLLERVFPEVCITTIAVAGRPALLLIAGGYDSAFEMSRRSDALARASAEALSRVLLARKNSS